MESHEGSSGGSQERVFGEAWNSKSDGRTVRGSVEVPSYWVRTVASHGGAHGNQAVTGR